MEFITKLRNRMSLPVGHALIDARKGDQYLASYPRSGSTWLRTMLVNVMNPEAHSNPDIFNATIPGVSIRQVPRIRGLRSPRIIHSHTYYRADIKRVIYTIRDGRDVLISFYHYLTTRQERKISFEDWFAKYEDRVYGHRWDENVTSWLVDGKRELGDDMLVVRFEEMKSRPVDTLLSACRHLGIQEDRSRVEKAVGEASLEKARKIEKSRSNHKPEGNASFYRGGNSGQWREYFTDEINARFWEISRSGMIHAGYAE